MIHDTIENMEEKIAKTASMRDEDRQELLKLLATLEKEIATLEDTPGAGPKHQAFRSLLPPRGDKGQEEQGITRSLP